MGLAVRRAITRPSLRFFLVSAGTLHEHWEHPRILGGQTKGSVVDLNDPPFESRKTRHVWNS